MPQFNITVDDHSPIAVYGSGWVDVDYPGYTYDKSQYSRETYRATNASSSVTISFTGTAATVYGAMGPDHGPFSVTVDGNPISGTFNGNAPQKIYKQPLLTTDELAHGVHELVITNQPGTSAAPTWLDVDSFEVAQGDQQSNANLVSIDDTNTAQVVPSPNWNKMTNAAYQGGSIWVTNTGGASLNILNFNGQAITIYGSLKSDHGRYSVSIDGATPQIFTPSVAPSLNIIYQYPLFSTDNLSPGTHTLTLINLDESLYLDFDYAEVRSWSTPSSSSNTPAGKATNSASPTASPHHSSNIGPIVGGVVAAVAGVAALAIALFLLCRHRRRAAANHSSSEPKMDLDGDNAYVAPAQPVHGAFGQDQPHIPVDAPPVYDYTPAPSIMSHDARTLTAVGPNGVRMEWGTTVASSSSGRSDINMTNPVSPGIGRVVPQTVPGSEKRNPLRV